MALFKDHKQNEDQDGTQIIDLNGVTAAEHEIQADVDIDQQIQEEEDLRAQTRQWTAEELEAVLRAQKEQEALAAQEDEQEEPEKEPEESQGEQHPEGNRDEQEQNDKGSQHPQKSRKSHKNKKTKRTKRSNKAQRTRKARGPLSRGALAARIVLGITVACILGTGAYYGYRYYQEEILPGREYDKAVSYREEGELDKAITEFRKLGEWGDAPQQILETQLLKARNQIDGGSYEDALVTLAEVGDYEGEQELHTQDLIDEANQHLSDLTYAEGLNCIKLYDYSGAADQFAAAQAYMERDDAAQLQEACEGAFDEVYQASFAEGRDADEDLQMTLYLWVHSVITPGEDAVPLGMQSDLATGDINTEVFGQSYMNYVYYGELSDYDYTFSYAGSEKDAADETRAVYLLAEFSEDYEQVTTSKVYADTGEVPAAPDIRLWNRVTDEDTITAVQTGIRNKLTMNLIASGDLDQDTYGNQDHTFTAYETIDDGFTLKTSEEIAEEERAKAEAEAEAASDDESGDGASEDNDESDEAASEETEQDVESGDKDADDEDGESASSMTEEERKAKAQELEQQEEEERLAAQQEAIDGLTSDYAIMVDAATGEILVDKSADTLMYPASMTKIMTILVAAEHVTDLTERAEITNDIIAYASEHQLTTVGWSTGEQVTVADLMWGTALCSGADAAKALANYVAGSETNYVDLMNEKVASLGLTGTHFANCTGVFSESNYTTPHDMALILYAAVQNPLARTVLSTRQYTTSFTSEHPAGITITNAFLRNMDQDLIQGVVLSAKTGFVSQSMFCAASYMIADDGEIYICVTGHSDTSANCRADHASLYSAFAVPPSHTDIEKYLEEILSGESQNVGTIEAADAN